MFWIHIFLFLLTHSVVGTHVYACISVCICHALSPFLYWLCCSLFHNITEKLHSNSLHITLHTGTHTIAKQLQSITREKLETECSGVEFYEMQLTRTYTLKNTIYPAAYSSHSQLNPDFFNLLLYHSRSMHSYFNLFQDGAFDRFK